MAERAASTRKAGSRAIPGTTFDPNALVNVGGVLVGEAATPTASESVAAGTATPPPTSSAYSPFGGNSTAQPFALLISLLLAGLAFALVDYRRRSIRR